MQFCVFFFVDPPEQLEAITARHANWFGHRDVSLCTEGYRCASPMLTMVGFDSSFSSARFWQVTVLLLPQLCEAKPNGIIF